MNFYKRICSVSIIASVGAIFGCSDATNFDFANSLETAQQEVAETAAAAAPVALFDPATGDIPFPNNLLFSGSEDGTLNIPLDEGVDPTDLAVPQVSLNTLDGFSTTSPITMQLSSAVQADSVVLGESVRIFEVQATDAGVVTEILSELNAAQVVVSLVGNTVAIVPLLPLQESTDYMVLATNGIVSDSGAALTPSSSFILTSGSIELTGPAAGLEPVRQLTNAMLAAAATEIDTTTVVQAFSFKTQSITPVLQQVKSAANPQAITIAPTGLSTSDVNEALPGIADIYIGTLNIPYYRTAPANANDIAGVNSFWQGPGETNLTRFNTTPVATSVQTIPVLMTVPNAGSGNAVPPEGWPVVIFVHGITRDRSDLLAVADSFALAGIAAIAIDQPMHGITNDGNPLSAAITPFDETERTFNIDLQDNETGAPGPDGIVDDSGSHFFSPQFLLATRDNLRQSAADLMVLSASIANITGVPLNNASKTVLGYSLGGAAATPFLAFSDSINAASLASPAAGLVGTVVASQAFGPPIIAGLAAAAGIEQGTPAFDQFVVAAQTVIDSGDAINFGQMAAGVLPIHMIEVIGDTTVPNAVPGSPLAGTSALARVMGLAETNQDTTEPAIVRFTEGNHATLLSPEASPAATVEMQAQIATFAATSGGLISITNADIVQ